MRDKRAVIFEGGRRHGKTMDIEYEVKEYPGIPVGSINIAYPDGSSVKYFRTEETDEQGREIWKEKNG